MTHKYNYYAFLSYCPEDAIVAEALRKKLESFWLPKGVYNECCSSSRLSPIYKKETYEGNALLPDEVRDALNQSKCLLLLCSPESANSECVNREVELFIAEGRVKQIIPYIVNGIPMCEGRRECFPPALRNYFKENPSHELLGIDTQKISPKSALYSVASTLLDVPYNKLWNRLAHKNRNRLIIALLLALVGFLGFYILAIPYRISIILHDEVHNLPILKDASGYVGTVVINGVDIPVSSFDTTIVSPPIPGYLRGKTASISFSATYYRSLNDTIELGYGWKSDYDLYLKRDNEFEMFSGRVFDLDTNEPIPDAWVDVDQGRYWAMTDSAGYFVLKFTLEEQSEVKSLRINANGYSLYEDEECVIDRNVPFGLIRKK